MSFQTVEHNGLETITGDPKKAIRKQAIPIIISHFMG